ncbi:hypothetical protein [uncultured Thiodictyon sp.]|uniref:hypothetical protein n=1 Tax=uncultured Thiodictyon sp. TaxID=1846217 RepID=UPI0025EC7313|nr:hypothetical protein [uncultured Thiodictyon sp.]
MKHSTKSDTNKMTIGRDQTNRHLAAPITINATIADAQIDAVLSRYGLALERDARYHSYFFDTTALSLLNVGVIARARRISGDDHDSTIKFQPMALVPAEVPARWREYDGYQLEADASEAGVNKAASLSMPVPKGLIKDVVSGEKGIAKLFSREHQAFLSAVGGQPIDYGSLCVLGPVDGQRWTLADPACPWHMTAELWQRADRARLMELAIKVPLAQAEAAIAGFRAFIHMVGAERNMKHHTKMRWALGHDLTAVHRQAAA